MSLSVQIQNMFLLITLIYLTHNDQTQSIGSLYQNKDFIVLFGTLTY